ncbi:MAG: class I SAM-dependent methyltransferase [Bacteroidales bacterium]|nr:class I SAM-dependent methyltransferase [Bacteroidales bacterium]
MANYQHRTFRIYSDDTADSATEPMTEVDTQLLAARELLRPIRSHLARRDLEPLSRSWFEELEIKRYAPHGSWLRRGLEFSRHAGESLVMLGAGAGSDALQYHRHGVHVTIGATPADHPEIIRNNFDLRGHSAHIVPTPDLATLPFDRWSFDLAYLNALHDSPTDLASVIQELYRVLKPGGKIFALFPAHYDTGFWQNILVPYRKWYTPPVQLTEAPRYSARSLKRLFCCFSEHRVGKRQLRRSELPYVWRFLPLSALERVMGRVLLLRAFKPVTAALEALPLHMAA